jgi:hypothetical protein
VALQKKKKEDVTMQRKANRTAVLLVAIHLLPLLVIVAQQTSSLIEGPQGHAKVIQLQGKNSFSSEDFRRPKNSTHIINPIDV